MGTYFSEVNCLRYNLGFSIFSFLLNAETAGNTELTASDRLSTQIKRLMFCEVNSKTSAPDF